MKLAFSFNLLGKTYMFKAQIMPTPWERTYGRGSRIPNTNKHVSLLDYDYTDDDTLDDEIIALEEEFKTGTYHIFATREEGRHCCCIDHFILNEAKRIAMSSSCDLAFVIAPRYDRFRNWVLRDYPKGLREAPKYLRSIPSRYDGLRLQSSAHAKFLIAHYNAPIKLINPDGGDLLKLESYLTAKRVQKSVR